MTPIPLDQLTMATARAAQQAGTTATDIQQGALLTAGAGVLVLGARYMARLVKADAEEQLRMRARLAQLEQARTANELTIQSLAMSMKDLHAQWRECEEHRAQQATAVARLETSLQQLHRRIDGASS